MTGRVVLAVALSVCAGQPVADTRAEVERLIKASGAEVAVAWRPLDAKPGEEILINPDLRLL